MDKTSSRKRIFDLAQLVVSGVVIGYYVTKGVGYLGFDISSTLEHAGMASGAIVAGILKAVHLA